MKNWVIILGYGRSGTTWLELELQDKISGVNLGELSNAYKRNYEKRICSCGVAAIECGHWESRLSKFFPEKKNIVSSVLESCPDNSIFIDSSKSTFKAWRHLWSLSKCTDQVYVIPIIVFRNPIYIFRSRNKGDNKLLRKGIKKIKPFQGARLVVHWIAAYLAAFFFGTRFNSPVYYVDFDDKGSIDELVNSLGNILTRDENEISTHLLEGNRLALFNSKTEYKTSRLGKTSFSERLVFIALSPIYYLLRLKAKSQHKY